MLQLRTFLIIDLITVLCGLLPVQNDGSAEIKNFTLIQRDRYLRNQVEELRAEKQRRLSTLKDLLLFEKELCVMLCLPTCANSFLLGAVPSHEELQKLTSHVRSLEAEKVT